MALVNCLCGAVSFPYTGNLPAPTELCHCNPCRHTSGALCEGFAPLAKRPGDDVLDQCTEFPSSQTHSRYFCSTCGTTLFIEIHNGAEAAQRYEKARWVLLSGAIDPPSDGSLDNVMLVEEHEWISDTGDGGLAPYLTKLGGRDIPSYDTSVESASLSDVEALVASSEAMAQSVETSNQLKAECRCGGVSFLIKRANHEDRSVSKLDRFIPRTAKGDIQNDKYPATLCACRSCRLQFGVSLASWVYVPPPNIINPRTGKPIAQQCRSTTDTANAPENAGLRLKYYWSSRDTGSSDCCRSFCRTCGAAVFYTASHRPGIINIAVGLLRAEEGVMARSWISWDFGEVSYGEEATDRDLAKAWLLTEKDTRPIFRAEA